MDTDAIVVVLGPDERWLLGQAAVEWGLSETEAARQMLTRDLTAMTGWAGGFGVRLRRGLRDRHESPNTRGDMDTDETPWDV